MKKVDYYVVLECERRASAETIKMSYRRLARRWHPDTNQGNAEAEERFKRVVEAWEVLGDPGRRAMYDRFGSAGGPWGAHGGAPTAGVDLDLLKETLKGLAKKRVDEIRNLFRRQRGRDIRVTVTLSFQEALRGVERKVTLPRVDSAGVSSPRTVGVPIPASVGHGKVLRWRGIGGPGVAGGESGDLYVIVHVEEHELFFFDGARLHVRAPIAQAPASRPASLQVPTPWGLREVAVPLDASPGPTELAMLGGLLPSGMRAPLFVQWNPLSPEAPLFEAFSRHVSAYARRAG